MTTFSNDNSIEYDDNEIEDNDDKIEDNDSIHEENETASTATLGDDFRAVRALEFGPGETRRLMDMRRSGAVEALVGGASAEEGIGSKLGNSIGSNKTLQKVYLPTESAAVAQVDGHRQVGRKRIAANKSKPKS
jgi:hypothetical protein